MIRRILVVFKFTQEQSIQRRLDLTINMKIPLITLLVVFCGVVFGDDVRLVDLDPPEAQQHIDQKDTTLKYAPKIESNVPAVRYLGNEPHNVVEDIYLANQYHGQDGLGGYLYGYSVPDIAKTERKQPHGDLRGSYNYIAGDGQEIKVEYWDDGTGFHQTDNIPKILPQDNDEVRAAKEEFLRIWQEEAERNSKPVQDPYNNDRSVQQTQQTNQNQYRQAQSEQYQQSSTNQRPVSVKQAEDGEDDGEYRPESDEEQGPPKGFFYNVDYPVGIIVQKDAGSGGAVHKRAVRSLIGYLLVPQQ